MKQLNMNGKLITGPVIFRENFNPVEFLYQKESACGFVYHNLAPLSPVAFYHAEVMIAAVFKWDKQISLLNHFAYTTVETAIWAITNGARNKEWEYVEEKLGKESFRRLTEKTWSISKGTDLDKDDRNRLFMILTAGYALAGKKAEDCHITSEEAQAAYNKKPVAEEADESWFTFADEAETAIMARETPYRILLCDDAEKKLSENSSLRIRIRKIIALSDSQSSSAPVILEIYNHPEDKNPKHLEIESGQSVFANFVGNAPVYFHIRYSETRKCIAETEDNKVVFTDKSTGRKEVKSFFGNEELICAHAEQNNAGYIALLRDMVYSGRYSNFAACTNMPQRSIVEVAFKGDNLYLLDCLGTVSAFDGLSCKESVGRYGSIEKYLLSEERKNG